VSLGSSGTVRPCTTRPLRGVVQGIEIVEHAYGPPVIVRREIVHNRNIGESLTTQSTPAARSRLAIGDGNGRLAPKHQRLADPLKRVRRARGI